MPSGSGFVTSGDESGGGRRRASKDKPKKSKLNRQNGDNSGDVDTGTKGYCLCANMYV